MRRTILPLVILLCLGTARATEIEEAAKTLVGQLAAGEFEAATSRFDDRMRDALPPDKLSAVWDQIGARMGAYSNIEDVRTEEKNGLHIVHVGTRFEKGDIDTRVVFDAAGGIAGLFFAPQQQQPPPWTPPDYIHTDRFDETSVAVESAGFELPGFLCTPHGAGPFPAVVLVHGSGPHDADETIGPNKPFGDLAGGLASRGVVVLRYAKRTLVMAQQPNPSMKGFTVDQETVDDALAAIALLRRSARVDSSRVFAVGHSLGAMMAPRIAARDGHLAGIVLLCGNVRPLEELALEQVRYLAELDGEVSADEQERIDSLTKSIQIVQSPSLADTTTVDLLGSPIPGSYWRDLRRYHPDDAAARLSIPILVVHGERDYQVGEKEFNAWKAALAGKPNVTFRSYPGLNHLLIAGIGQPGPREYAHPGHVAEAVVDDLAAWIADPRDGRGNASAHH